MKEVRNLSVGLIEKDELISVELDSDFCSTKFGSVALLPPYALVIDYVNISSFCLVAMNSFFKTQWNLDKRKLQSTLTLLYIILLVLSELGRLACACFLCLRYNIAVSNIQNRCELSWVILPRSPVNWHGIFGILIGRELAANGAM